MSATQELLRFGIFELNLSSEELRKSGTLTKLAPQPFQLLSLLARHAGQVVTRDTMQKQLWGEGTEVDSEHGMRQCVNQIRTALGDDSETPIYIETIPRQGYRFLARVVSQTVLAPGPKIVESSSSGIASDIASRVLARIAASVVATPAVIPVAAQPELEIVPAPITRRSNDAIQSLAIRRRKLLVVSSLVAGALVAVGLVAGGFYWYSRRPLTHVSAKEWIVAGSQPKSYEVGTDSQEVFEGHPSACLRSKEAVTGGFGTLMQTFGAREYLGKRVRLRAFAKGEGIEDWAGLWMRVDRGRDFVLDNMVDRPIKGTTSWQRYDVVLDVPQDATDIAFGVMLIGSGKIWLNGVEFEVVGSDVPTTGKGTPSQQLGDKPKLGFEK